ncbi:MAG: hypothetical protein LBD74_05140, partial [Spirochaetaceae bacterium]|nr:hypothetical protein [Spirochaetaceae bacterium]
IAAGQALINSFVAFTQILAHPLLPFPANVAAAGVVLATGIATQVKIMSTPIAAETGGSFTVSDTGGGVDQGVMRVNAGETVDVTPAGESGGGSSRIIVQIDRQTIFDVVNEGFRSGDLIVSTANV